MTTKKPISRRGSASSKRTAEQVEHEVLSASPEDEKVKGVKAARKAKAVADSAELTVEKVTQSLTKAGLDINKTLNTLKELFEREVSSLDVLREAIEAKTEELNALYDKEIVASSLRALVLKYQQEKEELKAGSEVIRDQWVQEREDHDQMVRERTRNLNAVREREEEEYQYKLNIKHRNDAEEWRVFTEKRAREQKETEENLNKEWSRREAELKAAEAEVAANKEKLDSFDDRVQEQVKKGIEVIARKIKSDHETAAKIAELEHSSKLQILTHENDTLKRQVGEKTGEIEKLKATIANLQDEVKEVALAAMESQSGRKALEAVQEVNKNQGGSANKR